MLRMIIAVSVLLPGFVLGQITFVPPPKVSRAGDTMTGALKLSSMSASGAGGILFTDDGGNTGLFIEDGGNIGVGTASPSPSDTLGVTLQIGDNLVLQTPVGDQVSFSHNAYFDGGWKRVTTDNASGIRFAAFVDGISFHAAPSGGSGTTITNWSGSDVKMVIGSAGNVGIGVKAPDTLLHVDGRTGFGTMKLDGDTGGCLMFRDTDDAGWTKATFLNGVPTYAIDADGICD